MAKVALLIGVSDYQPGLNPLPSAVQDVAALRDVLANEAIGGFDQVKMLENPGLTLLQDAVYELFEQCSTEDLVLLYFSGHGVKNQSLELFLTTPQTRKNDRGLVVPHTALSARYLQERMTTSRCQRMIVILDCCYSGAFAKGMTAKDEGKVDVLAQLGGKGRAILTSSTSTQSSFQQEDRELSIYTHYLVEGIKTGAADLDGDGQISADELHQYTHQKVTEESPAMTPEFYPVKEGHRIFIAQAPKVQDDPLLRYRKEVRRLVEDDDESIDFITGEFDEIDRDYLDAFCIQWSITQEDAQRIEQEVTEPLRKRNEKLKLYAKTYQKALKKGYPIKEKWCNRLKDFQALWGLRDEDIAPIEARLKPEQAAEKPQPIKATKPDTLPPKPNAPTDKLDQVELQSAKGADYRKLRDLLKKQAWREADEETRRLMLEVGDPDNKDYLDVDDIKKFPCEDLRTINELWTVASNGHFGFSVQKKIWQRVGGKVDWETECKLGDAVEWRKGGSWLRYSDLNFSSSAPEGHLPLIRAYWEFVCTLLSRSDL